MNPLDYMCFALCQEACMYCWRAETTSGCNCWRGQFCAQFILYFTNSSGKPCIYMSGTARSEFLLMYWRVLLFRRQAQFILQNDESTQMCSLSLKYLCSLFLKYFFPWTITVPHELTLFVDVGICLSAAVPGDWLKGSLGSVGCGLQHVLLGL